MSASSRRVRFGGKAVRVVEETDLDDLDKELIWYNRQHIQGNIQQQREQQQNDEGPWSETSCRRRKNHVQCVLSMQAEINDMGVQDATGLKAFAAALSKMDVKRARAQATSGATEAFEVYAQSTEWMHGITATDYSRATRVISVGRNKRKEPNRMKINMAALRIVGAV